MRQTQPIRFLSDLPTQAELPVTGSIDTKAVDVQVQLAVIRQAAAQRHAVRRFVDAARYARKCQDELRRQAQAPVKTELPLRLALHGLFMEGMSYFHAHLEPKEVIPDQVRDALHRVYNGSQGLFEDLNVFFVDLKIIGRSEAGRDVAVAHAIEAAEQALIDVRLG